MAELASRNWQSRALRPRNLQRVRLLNHFRLGSCTGNALRIVVFAYCCIAYDILIFISRYNSTQNSDRMTSEEADGYYALSDRHLVVQSSLAYEPIVEAILDCGDGNWLIVPFSQL